MSQFHITHWKGDHFDDGDSKQESVTFTITASNDYIAGMIAMVKSEAGDEWSSLLMIKDGDQKTIDQKVIFDPLVVDQEYELPSVGFVISFDEGHGTLTLASRNRDVLDGYRFTRKMLFAGNPDIQYYMSDNGTDVTGIVTIRLNGNEISGDTLFNDWVKNDE